LGGFAAAVGFKAGLQSRSGDAVYLCLLDGASQLRLVAQEDRLSFFFFPFLKVLLGFLETEDALPGVGFRFFLKNTYQFINSHQ
jgi:hypothetical protein